MPQADPAIPDLPTDYQCDVLIAGMGPVGAVLAALLGQQDLSVIVVEPEAGVYPLPRAAHIDHEIMRIFQTLGLIDAIGAHVREAPDYEFRTAQGDTLRRIVREGVRGASGWPVSYNVYQPGIEEAIRALLATMPQVRPMLGARFTAIVSNDADGVVAAIDVDGQPKRCRARFLVGCDGAWSPVRESCAMALDDYAFDEPWLVLDARVADESAFPPVNLQVCDPVRPTSFVHMGPGRLRWEFMLRPEETGAAMMEEASLATLLAPWRERGAIEVERRAVYRFHGLVASAWRERSVFIAGDSAHQMPPFMGQGLCSGLRDAANLAWKLAAAVRGEAGDALLDSYQQERDPHVRDVVEKAIAMGRVVCTFDPVAAAARDAAMLADPVVGTPVPFPPLAQGCILPGTPAAGMIFPQAVDDAAGMRLDDLLGQGAWLLHDATGVTAAPSGVAAFAIADLPPVLGAQVSAWLADVGAEAVLVRPDRYVFGTGAPATLIAAYAGALRS